MLQSVIERVSVSQPVAMYLRIGSRLGFEAGCGSRAKAGSETQDKERSPHCARRFRGVRDAAEDRFS